ncbi:succinate--CoA ligase [Sulfurovum sp. zt1-1]|uniref:1,4-dihydroxy-6-naphtoate synthase n=1 Tax=Sulfurovum zhangzhouensis TaxID=3019067 RepID=A0ABT7R051_9BACT|nr:MqnA/MqnD/SBP family protein [Sulfurovum zhangzhouensis]MDM5272423.1 succinate--CoA ligase [Sulfurovum zhangzhouensis]
MNPIQLAHSPDADDIFMYYAINFGWVDTKDYQFENIGLDIETLNEEALRGTYDVSAISFGMYPLIKDDYALLRTAVSFGEGYGPKLIRRKDKKLKRNFKVALSGKYTTNAMLFRIYYPQARPVYMNFLEIEEAVVNGTVDAGVLIHESILDFDESLEVEKEVWDIWGELAGEGLPLPLGGMAIRRSLPLNRAIEIENILIDGVKVANLRKKELCARLEKDALVRISDKMLEKYLDMYASDESIELSKLQIKALDKLFEIGYKHGLWEFPIKTEDYLIPREYETLRNS